MNKSERRLACFELWGGNRCADHPVELPGLEGWVYSAPLEPAAGGGDVHYFSVCSKGMVSRIAVADVAGHGSGASARAENLRHVLQRHTDNWDQSVLMRELNDAFTCEPGQSQYATAAVLGFYLETGELLFSSAGHPPVLWYRAQENCWELLEDSTQHALEIAGLPLGLIPGTAYSQTGIRLRAGDMLLLYTDGITETTDGSGKELGQSGLLGLVQGLSAASAAGVTHAVLSGVEAFRGNLPRRDDETLMVLQRVP